MASNLHPGLQQRSRPSFIRGDNGSLLNGQQPQTLVDSIDTAMSVASATLAKSPPPKAHQRTMSFTMGSQGSQNGMGMQHHGYRAYGDVNGYMQQHPPTGNIPQIYTVCNSV